MPHPSIVSDWRVAKRAAAVMASAVGATILQTQKGKPRVLLGGRTTDCHSWLSCWSMLFRIREDQVRTEAARRERQQRTTPAVSERERKQAAYKAWVDALPMLEVIG